MLKLRKRISVNVLPAIGLLAVLFGPARLMAQRPAAMTECDEYARKLSESQMVTSADLDALKRAEDKVAALNTTLKGYLARIRSNPEQFDQSIRAILTVLQQMKPAQAERRSALDRWFADQKRQIDDDPRTRLEACLASIDSARGPTSGVGSNFQEVVLTLTVLDRSQTVHLSMKNGAWNISSSLRQGIKLPSRDPAATNTTSRVKVTQQAIARVEVTSLPPGWHFTLGIGVDGRTPGNAENVCFSSTRCQAESGPYPGVKKGLGKGWAAQEAAEVWVCRGDDSCIGKGDPVAAINLDWVLP